jgi:PAS domain S-box-containing protein
MTNGNARIHEIYQAIFENCQLGLIVIDSDQNIVDWNRWVTKFSGLTFEAIQGRPLRAIFPDAMQGSLGRAVSLALSHGMSSVISHTLNPNTLPLFAISGAAIDQQLKVQPLDVDKRNRLCLIQINDITAAVKRDKQLLENLAEMNYQKYALDQHAIVAITDVKGTITYVNDLFCRISQYSREELLGNNHRLINSGLHSKEFFRDMFRSITKGNVWTGDICNRAKNGDLYWVFTTIVPNMGKDGKPKRYFAMRADISKLKCAEAAANAAAIAKSQFLANMSHEIRTPMNAILGLTRQVMETELTQDQRDQLNKVSKSSQALVCIINDILDFSRFESGYMVLEQAPIKLEAVLMEVSNLFGAQIDEKGIELFVEIDPDTPLYIKGDALRLAQILNNLIGNAVKFTDHGEIMLSVQTESRDSESIVLRFKVRDTGIGILPEHIKLLFNPFVQADNSTTRKFGGSGLGLSIVKKLVELMGGKIEVNSVLGHGSTFTFTIKAGIVPDEMQIPYKVHRDLQRLQGKRVLVVDDQATSRHILSRLLTAWGIQAVTAESGDDALLLIGQANRDSQSFYAVLLDLCMPGMNGLDVAAEISRQLKQQGREATLKLLMVRAYDKQILLSRPGAEWVDAVLTKPIAPSLLFDALLRRQVARNQDVGKQIARRFNGLRVLLVEDHDLNQEVAANFMKKRGVDVTVAAHGGEALEIIQQESFDLVLMDLHMPVMGGIEATQLIRALPQGRNLPIVAMTAAVLEEDRQKCTDAGMDDFISKPVEPEDLVRVMSRYFWVSDEAELEKSLAQRNELLLDLAQGLHRLDGDTALQQRLLLNFSARCQEVAKRFEVLISEADTQALIDLIHGLKGVSANLGAVGLADACHRLLEEMKVGEMLSRTHFAVTLAETLAQLQQYLADYTPPPVNSQVAELVSIPAFLAELERFICNQEVIPDDLLDLLSQLADAKLPSSPGLRQLQQQLSNFNHQAAGVIIKALLSNPAVQHVE